MVQLEYTNKIKPSLLDKAFFWLFVKITSIFCKNSYGLVSGWWQSWRLDYWAWKSVVKALPTNKMWVTAGYKVDFVRQLCTPNVDINVKCIVCINNLKSDRECEVDIEILSDNIVYSKATFRFMEKIHNYCVDSALKK